MTEEEIYAEGLLLENEDSSLHAEDKVSHTKQIVDESFVELNVDDILDNPLQPRMQVDSKDLSGLANSIRLHGLIQPISVIRIAGKYILKAGQRRLLAHKEIGLKNIKTIVQEATAQSEEENNKVLFEIAVIENTQRNNLHPLELALSFRQALDKKIYKNMEELAKALEKSKSHVSKVLKVLLLDDEIIQDLATNKSTKDIESLYQIQKIDNREEQIETYNNFIQKKIDREGICLRNKKKVSHEKDKLYKVRNRADNVSFMFNASKLTKDEVAEIINKFEVILKEYILYRM